MRGTEPSTFGAVTQPGPSPSVGGDLLDMGVHWQQVRLIPVRAGEPVTLFVISSVTRVYLGLAV